MKSSVIKLLPYAVGFGLGFLLFYPPAFLQGLGVLAFLLMAVLLLVVLLVSVGFALLGSYPAELELKLAADTTLPPDMQMRIAQLTAVGFRQVGPPLIAAITPPALLVPLLHEDEPIYATVFRTGTVPAKVSYDCVSIFMGNRGGLTTGPEPAAGYVPPAPGSLRQIFPGALPAELVGRHRATLTYLGKRGIAARSVDASTFAEDFRRSFARGRQAFLRRPVRVTVTTLWRILTHRNPYQGPLHLQSTIERQLTELVS